MARKNKLVSFNWRLMMMMMMMTTTTTMVVVVVVMVVVVMMMMMMTMSGLPSCQADNNYTSSGYGPVVEGGEEDPEGGAGMTDLGSISAG
nr:hypothetical protein BaRGS_032490 [Batillaria attramentaria]